MTTIVESRRPVPGREHSYLLKDVPDDGCEAQWWINGIPARMGLSEGGLRVEGFGRFELHVQLDGDLDDLDDTVVSATIHCTGLDEERIAFHAGLGTVLGPPLPPDDPTPPTPQPLPPVPDPGGAVPPEPGPNPPSDPDIFDTIEDFLKPDLGLPPSKPGDLSDVTFDAKPWPWWRRVLGKCPEGCDGELVWISIWPFYYTLRCDCGGKVSKHRLWFGFPAPGTGKSD